MNSCPAGIDPSTDDLTVLLVCSRPEYQTFRALFPDWLIVQAGAHVPCVRADLVIVSDGFDSVYDDRTEQWWEESVLVRLVPDGDVMHITRDKPLN